MMTGNIAEIDKAIGDIGREARKSAEGERPKINVRPHVDDLPRVRAPKTQSAFSRDDIVYAPEIGRFLLVLHAEENFLMAIPCNSEGRIDGLHPPVLAPDAVVAFWGRKG